MQNYFKGKKITVMGLGLLGRGIGDVAFLAEQGAELIVTDLKTADELAESLKPLKQFANITYVLGEHRLEDFRNRDFILKAAGVPFDSIYIAEAEKQGIPVEMSTALFAALTPATIVGITGTRGKSTVTHLLHTVLQEKYQGSETRVFLGGNVRGVSTLPFLAQAKKGDIAVLELDSWPLQGFRSRKISPHVAIFTTFLSDHQNYYKNDMQHYFSDKAAIFEFQNKDDVLIVGEQIAQQDFFKQCQSQIQSKIIEVGTKDLAQDLILKMPGEHNRYNAAIAVAAARVLGVEETVIKHVCESFTGVPGRLEFVTEIAGVKYYNDTTATVPDATVVALKSLGSQKNVVLIMGGSDKKLNMSELIKTIPVYTKAVVLLPGSGTETIKAQLPGAIEVFSMTEAVAKAKSLAVAGDVVLLSPAFASFGLFKNEFDRGEQFNASIKAYE